MTNDDATTIPVVLSYMATSSRYATKYDLLMTGSILSFLPVFVLFIAFQRLFVRGLTAGASKG
jgi:arabinosaccharide transport system permease protein